MFEIIGDEKKLYQWDTNKFLKVPDGIEKVRFSNLDHGVSTDVEVVGDTVEIPPELLQIYGGLYVWGWYDGNTSVVARFDVIKAARPADYVYTPTEIKTWEELEKRIAILEKGGASEEEIIKIVEDYLKKNPPEAGLDKEAVEEIVDEKTADKLGKSGYGANILFSTDGNGNFMPTYVDYNGLRIDETHYEDENGEVHYDGVLMVDDQYIGETAAEYISWFFQFVTFEGYVETVDEIDTSVDGGIYKVETTEEFYIVLDGNRHKLFATDKQDAFTVGDGLKLVDGVLSLDLDTWQGGEY